MVGRKCLFICYIKVPPILKCFERNLILITRGKLALMTNFLCEVCSGVNYNLSWEKWSQASSGKIDLICDMCRDAFQKGNRAIDSALLTHAQHYRGK